VPGTREWMSKMLLRAPAPLRSLRNVPVLGGVIHAISHKMVRADELVWVRVESGAAQGLWIELNPRTGRGYARGETETIVQDFISSHIGPTDIFYDLGANIGLFSLIAARITEGTGKVFSFEPDAQNARRLRRNVEHNGLTNVTVVESGVWSSTTELRFSAAPASSPDRGVGTFVATEHSAADPSIRVVSVDDFTRDIPPPTAIRCDVEGAEIEVLRGARATLERHHPWILCEMHSRENDRAGREFLQALGYICETVDDMHVFARTKGTPA
jgi:FkbM family methyltransferase